MRACQASASSEEYAFSSESIGTACSTVANPSADSPPTRRVGESAVARSGWRASIEASSDIRRSNSASVISGRASTWYSLSCRRISARNSSARRAASKASEPASRAAFLIGRPCYSLADAAGKGEKSAPRFRLACFARIDSHGRGAHAAGRLVPDFLPARHREEGRRRDGAPDLDEHDGEAGADAPVPPLSERVPQHALDVLEGVGRRAPWKSAAGVVGLDRAHAHDPRPRERPARLALVRLARRRQPVRPYGRGGPAPARRATGRDDFDLDRFSFAPAARLGAHRLERRLLPGRPVVPQDRRPPGQRLELPPVSLLE